MKDQINHNTSTTTKSPSPAQIAANRANALKSTGPKTVAGRNASRMNALKHGIFSSEILVRGRYFQENPEEFAQLHQSLCDAYNPVGAAEEMLVDQLVTTFWRTRRLQKAEAGEIALSVDSRVEKMEPTNFKRLQQQWKTSEHIEEAMAQSVEGNLELEAMLQVVRKNVVRQGALTDQAIAFVQLDGEPFELTSALEELLENLKKNPEKLHPNALRDWQKEQVLAFLDKELAEIGERIKMCQEDEIAVAEAHKAAAMVPSREVMDRIGLYETRLRRQFNTVLTQLERMQRARRDREDAAISENTQTKKRTQLPPENPNPETVSPVDPSSIPSPETVAKKASPPDSIQAPSTPLPSHDTSLRPQNPPNEKTNPNSPPNAADDFDPVFETLPDGEQRICGYTPRAANEKTNPNGLPYPAKL
jgi:hypothetical protein